MKILVEFDVYGVEGVPRDQVADTLQKVLDGSTAEAAINDGLFKSSLFDLANKAKPKYDDGECPDCGEPISEEAVREENCPNCGHVWAWEGPGVNITVRDDLNDVILSHEVHHLGEYCFSCGEHYTEQCIEGARCLSCGSSVVGGTTEEIAEQFEQLDDEIKQKILDHMKY
jgi:hypothetical protein